MNLSNLVKYAGMKVHFYCPKVVFFLSDELLIFIQENIIFLSKVQLYPIKSLLLAPEQPIQ